MLAPKPLVVLVGKMTLASQAVLGWSNDQHMIESDLQDYWWLCPETRLQVEIL